MSSNFNIPTFQNAAGSRSSSSDSLQRGPYGRPPRTALPAKPKQDFSSYKPPVMGDSEAEWADWRGGGYQRGPGDPGYVLPTNPRSNPPIQRTPIPPGYESGRVYQTMAVGEDSRPRQPGAAQPIQSPSQGTPYGTQPTGQPGNRQFQYGDMMFSEQGMGREAFESEVAKYSGRPQPQPYMPAPQAPNQSAVEALFRQNNMTMPQGFMDQLISAIGGQAPQSQYPAPRTPGSFPTAPEPRQPAPDFERPVNPVTGRPYGQQPQRPGSPQPPGGQQPPVFTTMRVGEEGDPPAPPPEQTRQQREDEIYNQLISGNYSATLKNNPSAGPTRERNARVLARRLLGLENAATKDGRAASSYERYFKQYGLTPKSGGQTPQPTDGGANPYQPSPTPMPGEAGFGQPAGGQFGGGQSGGQFGGGTNPFRGGFYNTQFPGQTGMPDPLRQAYEQSLTAWTMPKQALLQWGQQASQLPWGPNFGNTPNSRPSPYSLGVSGPFGNDLNSMYGNMGGFIQSVNNQAAQQPVGVFQGQGNPGPQYGRVNYNIPSLLQQGQQMVQGGWQNPFMQQPPSEFMRWQ